jgi:threonine/homoserine/homoserine lactone efflux protein
VNHSARSVPAVPEPATALFVLSAVTLIAVPGPNLIYIVTRGVGQGRRAGLVSALGIETGTVVHVAAAAVGLSALIASSATAFEIVKYAGTAYLLYLGIRTLAAGDDPGEAASGRRAGLGRVYAQGVLVNVLNPKVALFFLAFLPQFVDRGQGGATAQILVLGGVFFAIGLVLDMLYVLAASLLGRRLRRRPGLVRRLSGGIYIALAAAAVGGRR